MDKKTKKKRSVPEGSYTSTGETISVEIAPGVICDVKVPIGVQKYAFFRLQKTADGSYRVAPQTINQHVPLGEDIPPQLGLPIPRRVLCRLIKAGYVNGVQPSPGLIIFDLASLLAHLQRTKIDPDVDPFWDPEQKLKYKQSQFLL
jgi:hypothetical protein